MNSRYTVNCSILFTHLPLLDRPQAARDAGFDSVEFWWPFVDPVPPDGEVTAFTHAIGDAGVQLTGLNLAGGDMAAGDRGILSDPSSTTAFRDSVDVAAGIAETLNVSTLNALYGNRIDGISADIQDDLAHENIAFAAQTLARVGANTLIEPISGFPGYPVKTAADVVAIIDRQGREHQTTNLLMLADLYHLHVNGENPSTVITQHSAGIGHVQIADAPGRGEPGSGRLPISVYLDQLSTVGYRGYIGLEFKATSATPFAWLARVESPNCGGEAAAPSRHNETGLL